MNTIRHLNTIIRRMEDCLIVSKNPYEIEELQMKLRQKRMELQRMERKEMNRGVLI